MYLSLDKVRAGDIAVSIPTPLMVSHTIVQVTLLKFDIFTLVGFGLCFSVVVSYYYVRRFSV
jgi:hypothetical protein